MGKRGKRGEIGRNIGKEREDGDQEGNRQFIVVAPYFSENLLRLGKYIGVLEREKRTNEKEKGKGKNRGETVCLSDLHRASQVKKLGIYLCTDRKSPKGREPQKDSEEAKKKKKPKAQPGKV